MALVYQLLVNGLNGQIFMKLDMEKSALEMENYVMNANLKKREMIVKRSCVR